MKNSRVHLYAVVGLTTAMLAAMILWSGYGEAQQDTNELAISLLTRFGTVGSLIAGFVWAFDRYLWKLPVLNSIVGGRPDLNGTWRATFTVLEPSITPTQRKCFDGYMVIRQSYFRTSMRLHTEESQSRLRLGELVHNADGTYSFLAIYLATPHVWVRRRPNGTSIHRGAMLLSVQIYPRANPLARARVECMKGEWWTDHGRVGSLELLVRRPEAYDSFEAAHAADWLINALLTNREDAEQTMVATVGAAIAPEGNGDAPADTALVAGPTELTEAPQRPGNRRR